MKHKKYDAFLKTKKITNFVCRFLKKLCNFANHNTNNKQDLPVYLRILTIIFNYTKVNKYLYEQQ